MYRRLESSFQRPVSCVLSERHLVFTLYSIVNVWVSKYNYDLFKFHGHCCIVSVITHTVAFMNTNTPIPHTHKKI